jgi:peptide/nickel transport system permease protein
MAADPILPIESDLDFPSAERSRAWKKFWGHPMAVIGVSGLIFVILFSFVGPIIYHVDGNGNTPNLLYLMNPPSAKFPLGTDQLGRDYLSRVMVGGQLSLIVGFSAAFATMIIGVAYGLLSGYAGGVVDVVMMRIVDILLSIPSLFVLLLLDAMFVPSAFMLVFIIAFTSWFGIGRLVRAEVLSVKRRDYVEAARAFGASAWRIMLKELLPNVMGTVMVATTFQVAGAIITIATLSFLGLGLPPPTPNWGALLSQSMSYMYQGSWWLIYPPGILLLLTMLSFNFISEALRGAVDSRM